MDVDTPLGDSPHRPVNWRHRAARELVDRGRHVSLGDYDEAIVTYAGYLRRREACHTSADRRRLAMHFPALHSAAQISFDAGASTRFHLEARLLTGSTPSSVAAVIGITPDAVRWYERIYFDIWSRLNQADFVTDVVLGRVDQDAVRDWRDSTWKTAGYFGGPSVLDEAVCMTHGQGLDGHFRALRLEQRILLAQKIAACARQLDPADTRCIRALFMPVLETDGECEDLKDCIQAMLTSLPFSAIGIADLAKLDEHEKWTAERRTDELIGLHAGIRPANEADIASLTFDAVKSGAAKVPSGTNENSGTTVEG